MAKSFARSVVFLVLGSFLIAAAPKAFAAKEPFDAWLQKLKEEAHEKGISQPTINAAFAHVKLIERVVKLDRKQPEVVQTFQE
ncbi:MAG: lytic murein transglycosylase, partial [Alphaproteobacteria bacterium]